MNRDEILALVTQRNAVWAAHDAVSLAKLHAENGTVASPVGGVLEGRAEIERIYRLLFSAFPDIRMEQDDLLIDGDRVVSVVRMSGTHSGIFRSGADRTSNESSRAGMIVATAHRGRAAHLRLTGCRAGRRLVPSLRVIQNRRCSPAVVFEQACARGGAFITPRS